jgi:hypothetical protein
MAELEHSIEKPKAADAAPAEHEHSLLADAWDFAKKNPVAVAGAVVGGLAVVLLTKGEGAAAYCEGAEKELLSGILKPGVEGSAESAIRPIVNDVRPLALKPREIEGEITHIHFPRNASEGTKADMLIKAASHEPLKPWASEITHVDGLSEGAKAGQLMHLAARPPLQFANKEFPQTLESMAAKYLDKQ